MLFWQGYTLTGSALYDRSGSLLWLNIWGENEEADSSFTLTLRPGELPFQCGLYSDVESTDVMGTPVTGWSREEGGLYTCCSEFMAGEVGVRFENSGGIFGSEYGESASLVQGGAQMFNALLVRQALSQDGGLYLDHLLKAEEVPEWRAAEFSSLEDARQEAQRRAEMLYEDARRSGWETGHAEGVSQGSAQALEENRHVCEEKMKTLSGEVARFLERANAALDRQMDENIGELRELAIAVAEKVIAISLRSSSEVIGRMIQAAVDKRKRREWVRIYIAECDAKRMARLSPALTAALASLSSQVRIMPMADDESGTCIIEMPDEIIDASAATQIHNIRSMLADIPADETESPPNPEERSPGHVPTDDPPGLSCGNLQPDGKD